ncbi:MAG: pseudouridine synthase [Lachnospiraceae bacterium]|nr:pseudouridine synthase [Lachnospiraceae bacterium]
MAEQTVRLNKYLSEAGVCSRREADRRIEAGDVCVDGVKASVGQRILPSQEITFCGKKVTAEEEKILLLFHKPAGIVVTDERREKNNLTDFLQYPKRVFPVGRLDKASRGLLLLTNQGELVNAIMRARNYHEKEYEVRIREEVTDDFLRRMSEGIYLSELKVKTRKCEVKRRDAHSFSIILTQGLNRQIRRMCGELGAHVTDLKRTRIMHFLLDGIEEGAFRDATKEEWERLYAAIRPQPQERISAQSGSVKKGKR